MRTFGWISALILAAVGEAFAGLQDGLMLHLPCDEGRGDILRDSSATGAQVTRVGDVLWTKGADGFGNALDFRADREGYLEVRHDYGVLQAMTLSLRFYVEDPKPARWNYFLDTRSPEVTELEGAFYVVRSREGILRMVDNDVPADAYLRDVWTHLAILADNKGAQFYLDGRRIATGKALPLDVGDRLVLGNRFSKTQALVGMLDEIALWNRLLDPVELRQISERPLPLPRAVSPRERLTTRWAAMKREHDGKAVGRRQ